MASAVAGITIDKLFTVSQLAKRLHVDESTIRRWIRSRKLPAYRIGGRYVADESCVMQFEQFYLN